MNTKKCTHCGIKKNTADFGKNRLNPDGFQYWCRACFAAYHKAPSRRAPLPSAPGRKTCTRCLVLKDLTEFSKGSREADGLQDLCKPCNREVSAAYRAANAEKERKRHAVYSAANRDKIAANQDRWRKANPEKVLAGSRRFYANNKEKERARCRRWYAENADLARNLSRKWRENNIEYCRAYDREYTKLNKAKFNAKNALRKTRLMRALVAWADLRKIASFYAEAQYLSEETGVEHHVDHIVPLKNHVVCGLHCEDNLQILTGSENSKKNNKFTS